MLLDFCREPPENDYTIRKRSEERGLNGAQDGSREGGSPWREVCPSIQAGASSHTDAAGGCLHLVFSGKPGLFCPPPNVSLPLPSLKCLKLYFRDKSCESTSNFLKMLLKCNQFTMYIDNISSFPKSKFSGEEGSVRIQAHLT